MLTTYLVGRHLQKCKFVIIAKHLLIRMLTMMTSMINMILIRMMMSYTLFRLSDQSDSGLKTDILDSDHFGFLLEMYKARIFANITNEGEICRSTGSG